MDVDVELLIPGVQCREDSGPPAEELWIGEQLRERLRCGGEERVGELAFVVTPELVEPNELRSLCFWWGTCCAKRGRLVRSAHRLGLQTGGAVGRQYAPDGRSGVGDWAGKNGGY